MRYMINWLRNKCGDLTNENVSEKKNKTIQEFSAQKSYKEEINYFIKK